MQSYLDEPPPPSRLRRVKGELILLLQVVALVVFIRTFIFEPFYIPSGSMESSLQRGDFVLVWKGSYGYSKYSIPFKPFDFNGRRLHDARPKPGDVAVFRNPKKPDTNYIKRIIGTPEDRLQMLDGRLFLNGVLLERQQIAGYQPPKSVLSYRHYREILPTGRSYPIVERQGDSAASDNSRVYEVPPRHYFALGDNRDASQDSRYLQSVGYIPEENLIGRAAFIFFSIDSGMHWWELWRNIRFDRIGRIL